MESSTFHPFCCSNKNRISLMTSIDSLAIGLGNSSAILWSFISMVLSLLTIQVSPPTAFPEKKIAVCSELYWRAYEGQLPLYIIIPRNYLPSYAWAATRKVYAEIFASWSCLYSQCNQTIRGSALKVPSRQFLEPSYQEMQSQFYTFLALPIRNLQWFAII